MSKKLAIIVTKGNLDDAYPPFILASTAAALGYEIEMFFTFYGLQLLNKKLDLKVSSIGNPAMPMPVNIPVLAQSLPGMETMMTKMMKKKIKEKGVASIEELRDICVESDVRMIGCQMTIDLFDFNSKDFIESTQFGGAAMMFEFAGDADMTLFM